MNISEHMIAAYDHLKALVEQDGGRHSCIAGLNKMTIEPDPLGDEGEVQYLVTISSIRG